MAPGYSSRVGGTPMASEWCLGSPRPSSGLLVWGAMRHASRNREFFLGTNLSSEIPLLPESQGRNG